MIRRPPRSTQSRSSAASDVYKRQGLYAPALFSSSEHSITSQQETHDSSRQCAVMEGVRSRLEYVVLWCRSVSAPVRQVSPIPARQYLMFEPHPGWSLANDGRQSNAVSHGDQSLKGGTDDRPTTLAAHAGHYQRVLWEQGPDRCLSRRQPRRDPRPCRGKRSRQVDPDEHPVWDERHCPDRRL